MNKNSVTIHYDVQKELGISISEYRVLDFISAVMGDPKYPFYSFREVSGALMVDQLGLSKGQISKIVNDLIDKKLLKRGILAHGAHVFPTKLWYKALEAYFEEEDKREQGKESEA